MHGFPNARATQAPPPAISPALDGPNAVGVEDLAFPNGFSTFPGAGPQASEENKQHSAGYMDAWAPSSPMSNVGAVSGEFCSAVVVPERASFEFRGAGRRSECSLVVSAYRLTTGDREMTVKRLIAEICKRFLHRTLTTGTLRYL